MNFQKEDMVGTYYYWLGEKARSLFSGEPTRRLFDRNNGNQTLFIINYYGSLNDAFGICEGKIIEKKLADSLPFGPKSEISVIHWLLEDQKQ